MRTYNEIVLLFDIFFSKLSIKWDNWTFIICSDTTHYQLYHSFSLTHTEAPTESRQIYNARWNWRLPSPTGSKLVEGASSFLGLEGTVSPNSSFTFGPPRTWCCTTRLWVNSLSRGTIQVQRGNGQTKFIMRDAN